MSTPEIKPFLDNLWRWKCGLKEKPMEPVHTKHPTLAQITKENQEKLQVLYSTQWSGKFEYYMRNRMAMGGLRYGSLDDKNAPKHDHIKSIKQRIALYEKTGNQEYLVDSANLCLVEFEKPNHPNAHFTAIDDGIHAEEIKG